VVVPNETGGRPVDRQVTSRFNAAKIACYPGNRKNCARILTLVEHLTAAGFTPTPDPQTPRPLIEVYPHLSILHFFQLQERLLYKKGPVAEKLVVFGQLQGLILDYLDRHHFTRAPAIDELLATPWSKGVEDQTDAILCALTGHLHLSTAGAATTHLGCDREGFLVYPLSPHDAPPPETP
jgi:predicted RNase H-like nuclease